MHTLFSTWSYKACQTGVSHSRVRQDEKTEKVNKHKDPAPRLHELRQQNNAVDCYGGLFSSRRSGEALRGIIFPGRLRPPSLSSAVR